MVKVINDELKLDYNQFLKEYYKTRYVCFYSKTQILFCFLNLMCLNKKFLLVEK